MNHDQADACNTQIAPALRKGRRSVVIVGRMLIGASLTILFVASARATEIDKPLVAKPNELRLADNAGTADDNSSSGKAAKATETKDAKPAADDKDAEAKAAKTPAAPTVGSPAERSATALAFVREHHPELVELLERLKASNVAEHEKAIRELARTSDRLSVMRARNPERYALELELWKLKSQIQLLSARASLAPNEDLTSEIRALIERQLEVRAAQLELERSDLAERLDRVEAALQTAQADHQSQLDKQLNDVLRGIDVARQREADRRAKKPATTDKTKRDNKKPTKKPPQAETKPDAKQGAKPDSKKDTNK